MLIGDHRPKGFMAAIAVMMFSTTFAGSISAPPVYRFISPPNARWHDLFCIGAEICKIGDFNGDRKSDLVTFVRSTVAGTRANDVIVALSDGTKFVVSADIPVWQDSFCSGTEECDVGDFNGDGKDDIISFRRDSVEGDAQGDVVIALSDGTSFDSASVWHDFFCTGNEQCRVGDVNGDNKDDILSFIRDATTGPERGDVMVALSDGTAFGPATRWHELFCLGTEQCAVGDVNGDNKDDILSFIRDSSTGDARGDVLVALSDGTAFGPLARWHDRFCVGTEKCAVGDFNGDNKDDIILFIRDSETDDTRGNVIVALSDGARFSLQPALPTWHNFFCIGAEQCMVGDVDGDLKDDIISFVGSSKSGSGMGDVYVALVRQVSLTWLPAIAR
jgi:hypothetical protein